MDTNFLVIIPKSAVLYLKNRIQRLSERSVQPVVFDESTWSVILNYNYMLGGGFMGQAHQTNKQNREMLKKHKKDQKQFLSGAENIDSVHRKNVQSSLTLEQQTVIKRELEAKKQREKTLSYVIPIAAIGLAALLVYFLMY